MSEIQKCLNLVRGGGNIFQKCPKCWRGGGGSTIIGTLSQIFLIFYFDASPKQICCKYILRGGVTKKKRENLGQCPNYG